MKIVKFGKKMENYRIEDVASFEDKMADEIVKQGFAEEVTLESTKIVAEDAPQEETSNKKAK